jgi:hypothetical protein
VTSPSDPNFAESFGDVPDPLAGAQAPERPLRLAELPPSLERAQVRNRRVAAAIGSLAWVALHVAVFGVRRDLGQLPLAYLVGQILLPFGLAVLAFVVALASGKLGLGVRLALVISLAVIGPASFALIAAGAPVPGGVPAGGDSLGGMMLCFDITLAWAAVPLLFAVLTLRGAFAAAAGWRSALVGAGIGLFAGATINLHCSNATPVHMLFGHGLPVVVATLVGALLLAVRARS